MLEEQKIPKYASRLKINSGRGKNQAKCNTYVVESEDEQPTFET